jgi:N6-L-threonylcarbamoyladenine synthase
LTARLTTENALNHPSPAFPFMTLLISGGHTLLLTANSIGDYDPLGTTMDNAVGEVIDKTARLLNLQWLKGRRGGPGAALEKAALQGDPDRFLPYLPKPMLQRNKSVIAFSFSGLKSAVARFIEKDNLVDLEKPQDVSDMAAAFQMACIGHLEQKLTLALEQELVQNKKPLTALVMSGGVASNTLFRKRYIKKKIKKSKKNSRFCVTFNID